MSSVIYDISMSLDGYVRAANPTPEEPLGEGGEALHAWLRTDDVGPLLDRSLGAIGAMICGRVTYDDSIRWWQADGPSGAARLPLFVVSHSVPSDVPEGGVYTFVTSGIEDALEQARAAAGGRTVAIMGGPTLATQYLRAGLLDEVGIHLAPVLLGGGTRLTDALPEPIALELADQQATSGALHLRYRVTP